MNQQAPARQVRSYVISNGDGDGAAVNVCQIDTVYYAKIKLQMKSAGVTTAASNLPYLVVHATAQAAAGWSVATRPQGDRGRTSTAGWVHVMVASPGWYRIYVKEPTAQFEEGSAFIPPRHALADGTDSDRDVQPLLELEVIENADCTLSVRRTHPNGMARIRGAGNDQLPLDGTRHEFNESHLSVSIAKALDLGSYVISYQLWADASRTYGTQHPDVEGSAFADALRSIYGEELTQGTGTGPSLHDLTLTWNGREVQFNNQATTGGRAQLSFREDNGQPGNRMTADETLRRTHPATMEFLLQMMTDLDITYARSTGAWRPHIGSTRHRYASALDLTHVRTTVNGTDNVQHEVTIQFHRTLSTNSNPSMNGRPESAERTRMREFSRRVHAYIANARAQGTLGWLGGPWPLTYSQLAVAPPPQLRDGEAFASDATHIHHVHISMGTDQS